MNGSVKRDPGRGTWYFVIDAPGLDGKRRQVKKRGFRLKGEAEDALDAFRAQLALGTFRCPTTRALPRSRDRGSRRFLRRDSSRAP